MKKVLMLLLVCGVIISCGNILTLSKAGKNFTYCNEGQYTGLDTLINISGVYHNAIVSTLRDTSHPKFSIDTSYSNTIFWSDGTAASFAGSPDTCQSYFDKIVSALEKGKRDYFYKVAGWGNYRIIGDTIKVQYLNSPTNINDSWSVYEKWYKILDRNTLIYLPIPNKPLVTDIEFYTHVGKKIKQHAEFNAIAYFYPVEKVPPPNCWLKKKKLFWCNEKDWKEYKNRMNK